MSKLAGILLRLLSVAVATLSLGVLLYEYPLVKSEYVVFYFPAALAFATNIWIICSALPSTWRLLPKGAISFVLAAPITFLAWASTVVYLFEKHFE